MKTQLSLIERISIKISRVNEFSAFRRLQFLYTTKILAFFIKQITKNRIFFENIDWMQHLQPKNGVVFVGNHRTFFDLIITMFGLCARKIEWPSRYSFPVRSNYIYDNLFGILFNYIGTGGVMYPPLFRENHKKSFNQDALNRIVDYLNFPGAVIGMHPEGKRNKEPDPYSLESAKPGIGQIILRSNAIVIPFFITGLSDSLSECIKDNWKKNPKSNPIIIVYGQPMDYSQYKTMEPSEALYQRLANNVLDEIKALMPKEKEIRQACLTGEINHFDPRWL